MLVMTASSNSADGTIGKGVETFASGAGAPLSATPPPVPRVPSVLLFDIELEPDGAAQDIAAQEAPDSVRALRQFLLPASTGELQLRADVEAALRHIHQKAAAGAAPAHLLSHDATVQQLATLLTRRGYSVCIRTAMGGGDGTECLRNLRHNFVTVLPPGAHVTTARFVVDVSFRSQFCIAKPTPRYQALLACLPDTYVAPEHSIVPLVNFMCAEMATAFRATGTVLPPWRAAGSMLSKWLPRKSMDEQVLAAHATHTNNNRHQQQQQVAPSAVLSATSSMGAPPAPPRHTGLQRLQPSHAPRHPLLAPPPPPQMLPQPAALAAQNQARAALAAAVPAAIATAVKLPAAGLPPSLSQQQSLLGQLPVRACEPQRVVVGGNFRAIGFS